MLTIILGRKKKIFKAFATLSNRKFDINGQFKILLFNSIDQRTVTEERK
jgi:hypothetical protein